MPVIPYRNDGTPLPVGEVYLQKDPARMYEAVRRTKRPCLAFKILAAGRLWALVPLWVAVAPYFFFRLWRAV